MTGRKLLETWLFSVAIAHIVVGLALPFIAYSGLFDLYAGQIEATFWGASPVPVEATAYQRWMVALFGPTVASWGVLMAFLVRAGRRTQETWPWSAVLLAILAWAPADIAISLLHGFWPHVIIDCFAIILIAIPALILRSRAAAARLRQHAVQC